MLQKSNGPKTRLPKAAKSSSSVQQDDIEIEIAEVLFGLMKQSQNSKKEDDSFGKTVQKLESEDGISNNPDAKPSVSVLARKDSASSDLGGGGYYHIKLLINIDILFFLLVMSLCFLFFL